MSGLFASAAMTPARAGTLERQGKKGPVPGRVATLGMYFSKPNDRQGREPDEWRRKGYSGFMLGASTRLGGCMHMVDERGWWLAAPPGSDEDLEQRLALASPSDTARGMFLRATLEAVRVLGDEEAVRQCQRASGEETLVDFFSYPVSANLRMVFAAARMLEGRYGGIDEALRQLGFRAAESFLASTAGLALQLLARGDTKRLMGHLPSVYRASVSFGSRSVVWLGPSCGRLTMWREFMPSPFQEGMLLGVLRKANVRGARVLGHQLSTLESDYDISWEA